MTDKEIRAQIDNVYDVLDYPPPADLKFSLVVDVGGKHVVADLGGDFGVLADILELLEEYWPEEDFDHEDDLL